MHRARCQAVGQVRLANIPGFPTLVLSRGRVALFATSHTCNAKAAKKAAEQESEASADETRGLSSWTTLQEKLRQSLASSKHKSASSPEESPESKVERSPKTQSKKPTPKSVKSTKPTKRKRRKEKEPVDFEVITPKALELEPIDHETPDIPKLSYGLDRALFNGGVYRMQDARTNVYNFDPYLASIMPVDEFDYDALKEYVTSSKDTKLRDLAKEHGKKYSGSTSSMTAVLSHLHFLISGWRPPNFDQLSRGWTPESNNFTILTRGPVATFIKYNDGVYSIDSDKEYDSENVLSMLGKSMEKLLTLPKEEFEKYKKTKSHQLTEEEKKADEAYHYTTFGDFMMRSQLDAHDPRLPGTGVFDLKTRAVVTIRMDVQGHEKGVGYEIRKQFGQWESFEREYYDLIRSAFLKYSLQVRMGRMDGIFVAYHNTQRIFGFQYIPLSEMDHALHGQTDTTLGDQEFKASLSILNDLMDRATKKFPNRSLRLHVETRPTNDPVTYFFVEPVTDEEMQAIQESKKASVDKLKEEIDDLSSQEKAAESAAAEAAADDQSGNTEEVESTEEEDMDQEIQNELAWQEVMDRVSEAVDSESLGIRSVRDAVQDALAQSGLLEGKTEAESTKHIEGLVSALTAHSQESKELESASEEEPADAQHGDETPLKDLILRVTEGIDENATNLNEFQRMFASLSEKPTAGEDADPETEADANAEAAATDASPETSPDQSPPRELLGMYITIRNKVDGKFVARPERLNTGSKWEVQYAVKEISDERAERLYKQIKARRRKILDINAEMRAQSWHRMFAGSLPTLSKRGASYRAERTKEEEAAGIRVAWERGPGSSS
ncbi:mitochondrial mRNA processing protein PET127, putative [Cordyceps militaris CM01]|uniref:Mitochondrial mRNA processing protein PET127, putative n=1 Tax=Cordyceps militaris (strain CM01) TaxID=983644 RepID=G3J9I3_CORMM|nr:mitochondrial mRNA processing protein PET127, putative [Cordyceps militaris CM01]EGX94960.1 mitochondrial mRNA processing protein PET127, putative [Cordyceps militaris CM01]